MKLYKKFQVLLLCGFAAVSLQAQCPTDPDGLTFTTQAAIDNFPINYPGCTNMPYNIFISGGNTANITNLNGLSQLNKIGGSLLIFNNTALNDLSGLSALTTVSGSLFISQNPGLTDVSDLSSLTYANAIIVVGNASLTSLSGLDGAAFANAGLFISQNPQLSVCDLPNICYYLSNPANVASIFGNATGCADRTEVEAACPPPLTCKGNVLRTINNNTCQATLTVSDLLDGGPYNPNDYTIEIFESPISAPPIASGTGSAIVTSSYVGIPLTFRVTKTVDGSLCEGILLVEDVKNPTPYCQSGLIVQLPPVGPVTLTGINFDAGSFDNCGSITFSISQNGVIYNTTTDLYCPGTFPIYMGVTDVSGNFDYCLTYIDVQDNFGYSTPPPPNVVCNDNVQFPLGANCQAIINVFDLLEGGPYGLDCYYFLEIFAGPGFTNPVTSGYGSVVVAGSGLYPGSSQTLIYRITNTDSGNSCSGTIHIEDYIPPVIVCPPDQTVNFNGDCAPLLPPPLLLSDNCTPSQEVVYNYQADILILPNPNNRKMEVTYTAQDYNFHFTHCKFTVFINNIDPLPFSCPNNQSRTVDLNECDYTAVGQEFDFLGMQPNCAGLFSFDWALSGATSGTGSGSLVGVDFLPGNTLVQWSATSSGLSANCSFTVSVAGGSGGAEICNGIDDNCDGQIDEGLSQGFQFNYSFTTACSGSPVNITWAGGCPTWLVDISLALVSTNTGVMAVATGLPNTGSYTWTIPANLPAGTYFFYVPGGSSGGNGIPFYVGSSSGIEICNGIDDNCNGQIDEGNVCCPPGPIVYVKANATGQNNGTSWADAYTDLQTALTSTCPGITQIWVAAGTYKPTSGTDRSISFVMKNNLAIYGGFNGTETLLSQRNWVSNVTVLSGDIGVLGNQTDNSFHVIYNYYLINTAIIDGFTVTLGNATGGNYTENILGGGMFNYSASPMVTNCSFIGNRAHQGGGMYSENSSFPIVTNCSFSGNWSQSYGSGIYSNDGIVLTNCLFDGNHSNQAGGGITAYGSSTLIKCTFTNNSASDYGGGIFIGGNTSIIGCYFSGNSAGIVGGGISIGASSGVLSNCTFIGNSAQYGGGGINNGNSLVLTNCSFSGNKALAGGSILNHYSSLTLKNCIVWGNSSGVVNQSGGSATYTNTLVQGLNLGGGVFNGNTDPLFVNQPNFNNAPTTAGDLHLQPCSPAIDAGTNTGAPLEDLDSNPRPHDGDANGTAVTDLGAYEHQGTLTTWYKDQDNDGYSDGTTKIQCNQPGGYKLAANLIATSGDCQDGNGNVPGTPNATDASIHPNAPEVCNGIDDNCDGTTDETLSGFNYTGTVVLNTQAKVNVWPSCYSKITGNLTISGSGVTSLAPLANLTEVTGNVTILSGGMANLSGLDGLTTIGGNLAVRQNNSGAKLSSLLGLQGLVSIGGNLQVMQNNSLWDCCAIEALLMSSGIGGTKNINNNLTNCNTEAQILAYCPLFTGGGGNYLKAPEPCPSCPVGGQVAPGFEMTLFPNPTSGELSLSFLGELPKSGSIQVVDLLGSVVLQETLTPNQQEHTFSLSSLPASVYFVKVLEDGVPVWVEKLIKD